MTTPTSRRGFLRGLTTLPLIGGGLALIGQPTAVAEPVTAGLLDAYDTFLFYERCRLNAERLGERAYWQGADYSTERVEEALRYVRINNPGLGFHADEHFSPTGPAARAALVMSAVGCGWREGRPCA